MRAALALFLLLALPAWSETQIRRLQNDSDVSVQLRMGDAPIASFDKFGQGNLRLDLPQQGSFLDVKTRAGMTRLYESNGLIYAVVNGAEPKPISNRVNQYLTLFIDMKGNVRIKRWEYWYN